jgi:hypothetical protein
MDVVAAATNFAAQSAAGTRSSIGIAVAKQAIDTERATVEWLLAPPAPVTGTTVDKLV